MLSSARIERRTLPQIFVPMLPDMSFRHATVARLVGTAFLRRLFWSDAVLTPFSVRAGAACKGGSDASLGVAYRRGLLIAVGLLSVPAANAQVQSPSPGLSDQSSNISDQKLDAVATAIERVASLKQDYQQRIAAAAPSDGQGANLLETRGRDVLSDRAIEVS